MTYIPVGEAERETNKHTDKCGTRQSSKCCAESLSLREVPGAATLNGLPEGPLG